MLIFVDESGVHKETGYSTFSLVYIKPEDYYCVEKQVQNIERKLGIDYFHWAKAVWKVKEKFMEGALKLNFTAKVVVVKNPVNAAETLEKALMKLISEKDIKGTYLDGKKSKWYEKKMKKILRDKGIATKKLKTVRSSQWAGIRLADMIAGLTRSYFDKKNIERISKYYHRFQKKTTSIVEQKT